MFSSRAVFYCWQRRIGRWVDPLPVGVRSGLRRLLLGGVGVSLHLPVRIRLARSMGWGGAWRATRQQLALHSVSMAAPASAGQSPDALQRWSKYSLDLYLHCPHRSGLPWPTVAEARLWPQLDCKGRAILLARDAYVLGLPARLCVGMNPHGTTAHAWVEIWSDGEWWAGDGLAATIKPSVQYTEEAALTVLHRYDVGVPVELQAGKPFDEA